MKVIVRKNVQRLLRYVIILSEIIQRINILLWYIESPSFEENAKNCNMKLHYVLRIIVFIT